MKHLDLESFEHFTEHAKGGKKGGGKKTSDGRPYRTRMQYIGYGPRHRRSPPFRRPFYRRPYFRRPFFRPPPVISPVYVQHTEEVEAPDHRHLLYIIIAILIALAIMIFALMR